MKQAKWMVLILGVLSNTQHVLHGMHDVPLDIEKAIVLLTIPEDTFGGCVVNCFHQTFVCKRWCAFLSETKQQLRKQFNTDTAYKKAVALYYLIDCHHESWRLRNDLSNLPAISLLVNWGANVHCPIYPIAQQQDPVDFDTMESAWIHAAVYGLTDVISHFVAHGAHMDSLDWYHYKKEMTALMVACKYDHIDLVQFLLSNGANDAITDDEGKMALDYTDNPKIIELLLMHDMHKVAGMRNEDTHGESDEDQNGLIWGTLEPVVSEELSTDSDSADELKPSAARGIG